jgi:uncharacterized Zn finger protein
MKRKFMSCDTCGDGAIWLATGSTITNNPEWECQCCGTIIERRVYATKKRMEMEILLQELIRG